MYIIDLCEAWLQSLSELHKNKQKPIGFHLSYCSLKQNTTKKTNIPYNFEGYWSLLVWIVYQNEKGLVCNLSDAFVFLISISRNNEQMSIRRWWCNFDQLVEMMGWLRLINVCRRGRIRWMGADYNEIRVRDLGVCCFKYPII